MKWILYNKELNDGWLLVVYRGGRIPKDVHDYSFAEIVRLYRKTVDPEIKRLLKILRDRQIIRRKTG